MLSDTEYRDYLDQPKHTLAKLKSIATKIVGTVKADLAGKTRAEVIDHLIKYTGLDESMNIKLKSEVSLINAVKARKPRSDKGKPRGSRKPKEVMQKVEVIEKPIEKLEPMKPKKKLIRKQKMME